MSPTIVYLIGFISCYIIFLGFSLIDFIIEKTSYYRDMRKNKDDYIK